MVKILGLDTETVIKNDVHTFYSFQLYSNDFEDCRVFSQNKDDFTDWLNKKTHRAWFITFNLSFDAIIISRMLKDTDYKISAFYAGTRLIRLTIRRGGLKWVVVDLRNIFPNTNLEKIGKVLQLPKMEKPSYLGKRAPETPQELQYFIKYAMRDSEICYKMAKLIQDEFKIIKSTCAGLAIRIFKRDYCYIKKFHKFAPATEEKLREAYHGGRTECFIRGTAPEAIKCYDVNSLYPFVMRYKPYPFAPVKPELKTDINLDYEGITQAIVSVDANFPPIATKYKCKDGFDKLCFVNGKYKGWFTNVELRELEQYNCGRIEKVFQSFEWKKTFNPFERFVDYFYSKKESATLEGSPKVALYKINLNGLYGKFGEHGTCSFFDVVNGEMLNKSDGKQRDAWYHSSVMACYITAYARLHLWHMIKSLNPQDVYYCDTDAIWCATDLSPKCSSKLGDLKIEHEAKAHSATFIRSKFYMYDSHVVMKGFHIEDTAQTIAISIYKNDFTRYEHRIAKALEANRIHKPALYDYTMAKRFSIEEDCKRKFDKLLDNKSILVDFSHSQPIEVKT